MDISHRLVAMMIFLSAAPFATHASDAADDLRGIRFLDNGTIRLGVDLDHGGAITYLSLSGRDENVVNNYDLGRQIQMSFYSGPVPYSVGAKQPQPHWAHIGWNPIQSGDDYGHGSRVVSFTSDLPRNSLRLRAIPLQWPLDDVAAECVFESTIELKGPLVHVAARLENRRADKSQYAARHQELPAVYVNGPYYRLVTYTGERPFADDGRLTHIETTGGKAMPWKHFHPTENWAALLRDDDFGIGVYHPECFEFAGGFSGPTGKGGARDPQTGYLAPVRREIIDHDSRYSFDYVVTLGKLDDIRSRFAAEHKRRQDGNTRTNPTSQGSATPASHSHRPDYRFQHTRHHWYYANCHDAGLPIEGELNVSFDADDPQLLGPPDFWQAADAPKLLITAAFRQAGGKSRLFWKRLGQTGFTEQQALDFAIVADGAMRTYEIDLAGHPEYRGAITGLRLDPVERIRPGDGIRLRSIASRPLPRD